MRLLPRLNTLGCLAGIAVAAGVIVWTETYTWRRVAAMRERPVTSEDVASIQRMLGWSSAVLLATGAALSVLMYRGLLVPLRRRLEQSRHVIERQEKLSSLGVLAAGVAHEIRNPLTSIKVRLYTQQALLEQGSEAHEDNVFITEEIVRLEKIVKDFLAFARPGEPEFKPLRPGSCLRDIEALLRPSLSRHGIRLEIEMNADAEVRADLQQLKQVLINLVQNAAEAIRENGVVTLRSRLAARRPGRSHLILEVEDDGPGVPREAEARLFDPFFTTKPNGTGLGLSIAARILEKHGGRIEYRPGRVRGSRFLLFLPVSSAGAPAPASTP